MKIWWCPVGSAEERAFPSSLLLCRRKEMFQYGRCDRTRNLHVPHYPPWDQGTRGRSRGNSLRLHQARFGLDIGISYLYTNISTIYQYLPIYLHICIGASYLYWCILSIYISISISIYIHTCILDIGISYLYTTSKGWSGTGTAAQESPSLEGFERHMTVAAGNMFYRWPWQRWGNSQT